MVSPPYCLSPARFLAEWSYRDLRLLNVATAYRLGAEEDAWPR